MSTREEIMVRASKAGLWMLLVRGLSRLSALTLAILPLLGGGAAAQAPTVAEPAGYSGPDRMARLLEGAKKEGTLTLYTSVTVEDMGALTAAFEEKYGVKVKVWRASAENVLQRAVIEARAGRFEADAFELGGREMESLHREKILQEVKTPALAELFPQAILPHGEWVGTRLNIFAFAYNTNLVKKDEAPKGYQDLLDPKWKGRLGIEAEDYDWLATLAAEMGEEKTTKMFREIVAKNGISVRKGHTLLTNFVASGEVPMALTNYLYKADQLKNGGAPLDWFILPPAVARVNGAGVARRAPHPHAAVLFLDFMLTDAQKIMAERSFTTTNTKVKPLPAGIDLKLTNSAQMLDESAKWSKLYDELFVKQARER
jgi:iron(III) transport system substrate-binding protein